MFSIKDILKEADHTPTADNCGGGGRSTRVVHIIAEALLADQEVCLGQLPPLSAVVDNLDRRF